MRRFQFPDGFAILLVLTVLTGGLVAQDDSRKSGIADQTVASNLAQDIAAVDATADAAAASQRIQMAILLDTSNSMDGLINQARGQIWKIVNEFATAKGPDGSLPDFQVALFEYGNNSLDAGGGHIRMVTPFTTDLDKVSEDLFGLTTNGGEEYCGHVIQEAVKRLEWSESEDDLKLIFVAGNEPYTQGTVDPYQAGQTAIERSITVNTIFCGDQAEGVNTGWQKGALLADGSFINIDQNVAAVAIETPQDKKLAELSEELNKTFVFFGTEDERELRRNRQTLQDRQAAGRGGGVAASRAVSKAGRFYRMEDADLVTAVKEGKVKLEELSKDHLPDDLKDKSAEEIAKYLEEKLAEREKLQAEIKTLATERDKYIATQTGGDEAESLGTAVLKAVRDQAAKKNIQFDKQDAGGGSK